jgi:peptidoglycan/xylan/chitin deacetylase (PgdA/CDA1 family)
MYFTRTPAIVKALYSDLVWSVDTDKKEIYLTFDDGPVPEVTIPVLEILDKYNAQATFFCIGNNIQKHPDIFRLLLTKKHAIGNHTHNHLNGWAVPNFTYYKNILQCHSLFNTKLFRPPYGKITRQQSKVLKKRFAIVMWDVLSADFDSNVSAEQCYQNVIQKATQGSIIVFHDSVKAKEKVLFALPRVLDYFSKKGFVFKKIEL